MRHESVKANRACFYCEGILPNIEIRLSLNTSRTCISFAFPFGNMKLQHFTNMY